MGVGVGGLGGASMDKGVLVVAETRDLSRPPVLIFMAAGAAASGTAGLAAEAVLDTSLCASRGRFKRDTKISLTTK